MNNEELEQAIEGIITECDYVHVWDDEIVLDGNFTCQELVAIAELLKKEGRV